VKFNGCDGLRGAGLCEFEGLTFTEFSRTQEHQMRHFNLAGDATSELGIDTHGCADSGALCPRLADECLLARKQGEKPFWRHA
jgi:hypothetical protein